MDKARKLAEKPHCVDFHLFDGNLIQQPNEMDIKPESLIGIKMRKVNYFINKEFANGLCILDWSKLKMYASLLQLSVSYNGYIIYYC